VELKTQTVVGYAHRHSAEYAHAFWATADPREAKGYPNRAFGCRRAQQAPSISHVGENISALRSGISICRPCCRPTAVHPSDLRSLDRPHKTLRGLPLLRSLALAPDHNLAARLFAGYLALFPRRIRSVLEQQDQELFAPALAALDELVYMPEWLKLQDRDVAVREFTDLTELKSAREAVLQLELC
jgi:hypothetical protein